MWGAAVSVRGRPAFAGSMSLQRVQGCLRRQVMTDVLDDLRTLPADRFASRWIFEGIPHVFGTDLSAYVEWKSTLADGLAVDIGVGRSAFPVRRSSGVNNAKDTDRARPSRSCAQGRAATRATAPRLVPAGPRATSREKRPSVSGMSATESWLTSQRSRARSCR